MQTSAGMWVHDTTKSALNYREFWNLVKLVEYAVIYEQLTNAGVFSHKNYFMERTHCKDK